MKLHISPCPNDTFTFHAMIHSLVDTEGIAFEPVFDDIDALNGAAIGSPEDEDVIKISYAALPAAIGSFRLLDAGSALGYGNGPLLVSKHKIYPDELGDVLIGIPGERTTANRLLSIVFPEAVRKRVYLFSEIAQAVAEGELDAGVLIHEERFTYASLGLGLVADLGAEWEKRTGLPIPLGGILLSRKYSSEAAEQVGRIVRRSIEYAQANPGVSAGFVRHHAQEMDPEVRQKHISFFVNDFSLGLGPRGMEAVAKLTGLTREKWG